MPFVSPQQERFMWARHPSIAKRWASEFGSFRAGSQHFKPSPQSESHETWAKGKLKLPRVPGPDRDFSHLKPSQSARHLPKGPKPNEKEAMDEGPGVQFMHGSRHSELGVAKAHKGLKGRDQKMAETALIAGHRI